MTVLQEIQVRLYMYILWATWLTGHAKASTCQQAKCLKNSKKIAPRKQKPRKKCKNRLFFFSVFLNIIMWHTASIVLQHLSVPLGVQPAQDLRHNAKVLTTYSKATCSPGKTDLSYYYNTQHTTCTQYLTVKRFNYCPWRILVSNSKILRLYK